MVNGTITITECAAMRTAFVDGAMRSAFTNGYYLAIAACAVGLAILVMMIYGKITKRFKLYLRETGQYGKFEEWYDAEDMRRR